MITNLLSNAIKFSIDSSQILIEISSLTHSSNSSNNGSNNGSNNSSEKVLRFSMKNQAKVEKILSNEALLW